MKIGEIRSPKDIKQLNTKQLNDLASEIRNFLISSIAKNGGHLSSNLGIVELTLALHYVFDSPKDKIFFDVGHQCYTHKILTGRANKFPTLRQYEGLSGFQKRKESEHDVWEAGHSSTSLSAALGFAVARDLKQQNYQVIPVIGDGAMASGMSFEALNQIGSEKRKMMIIFNDNNMSISGNVGAFSTACTHLRASKGYNTLKRDLSSRLSSTKIGDRVLGTLKSVKDNIKNTVVDGSIFTELGLDYIGPIDGHNIEEMINIFNSIKNHEGPIVVHVITKKGKGYTYAENDKEGKWHGVSKFDIESGKAISSLPQHHLNWSSVLSETLIRLAKNDENIVALTPAMSQGSKLDKFASIYPERFFDCGIAEEHAITFAGALSQEGIKPFISVYSSFLQRAYDQMNHDIGRMDLPIVVGVDRSGLVGDDGETHHGVFDISMLYSIPNLIITMPKDSNEAQDLMYSAFKQLQHPYLIRIPRGSCYYKEKQFEEIECGSWSKFETNADSSNLIVITYGNDVDKIINKAISNNLAITVVNARFIKPLDITMLNDLLSTDLPILVYEGDMLHGGLSSAILEYCNDHGYTKNIIRYGIKDHFVPQGSLPQLRKREKIDLTTLFDEIERICKEWKD